MAERNNSHLLDGGDDPMGMTDNQYKGMLLDQLEDWQEVLDPVSYTHLTLPTNSRV